MDRPRLRIAGTVLSTRDPRALADFYQRLLGWPRLADEPGWVVLRPEPTAHGISFHHDDLHVAPTWPSEPGAVPMTAHLDIATDDLEAAVAHAVACGATVAGHQPQRHVRVMLDPDGNPFCLFPGTGW